ncbi:L-cysteine desulfidase family protein [Merdimmobilis hominis]|uniref:L-cysteine desulfidase family protein n=1 Tax=Merdimmobilis hominis TaxID=2897707 RepID=UPI0006C7F583|nr:L-serine ammonia-lyase, iron-sulfur-dependent, subunit alpha [Merdimmobilis hominis]PWL58782.1 MAG: serine dehydratase subunit alpha family protein [Oscillospiraceae bacterium]
MTELEKRAYFLDKIMSSMKIATGCTEPVAIALNAATARKNVKGELKEIHVKMDMGLFRNAMTVGIPGISKRGVDVSVAVGIVAGDPDKGMDLLSTLTEADYEKAKVLLPMIEITFNEECTSLFIETTLVTDCDSVRVTTFGAHDRIIDISHPPFKELELANAAVDTSIQNYTLADFIEFANNVPLADIEPLQTGIDTNLAASEVGKQMLMGKVLSKLTADGMMDSSAVAETQKTATCAAYARMSGGVVPVMTASGSGNQGITLYLTIAKFAMEKNIDRETTLRAVALGHMVNIYVKSYIGVLSPICSCGIAAGLGASVAIVYMLGGSEDQMMGAMRNILGSVSGMLCDGAKEGCATKLLIAANISVLSALMAMEGLCTSPADGIVGDTFPKMFENLAYVANVGMKPATKAMVDVMLAKRSK